MPIANDVPWPAPLSTFVPFGYAAVANESAIAPMVGPGLPLLMAAMKAVGGHAALFLVVPITAALLIWATFGIGRQLGSARLGLGAAWLVATSPAFLTMIKEPMSDVPAAAFWALATWKVLDDSRFSAALAGAAAAMAILIRPNLVPLAAVLGVWMLGVGTTRRAEIGSVPHPPLRQRLSPPVWRSRGSISRSLVRRSRPGTAAPRISFQSPTCGPTSRGTAGG